MYKILFPLMALLTGCSMGQYDTIQPDALNNIACPKIQIDYDEKEFLLESEDGDISISSLLAVKGAKCIADKNHIRLTTDIAINAHLSSTLEGGHIIALPLSYHILTLLPNDGDPYPVQKKIFFMAQDFTTDKKEGQILEQHTIKILKSDVLEEKAIIKIGFSK